MKVSWSEVMLALSGAYNLAYGYANNNDGQTAIGMVLILMLFGIAAYKKLNTQHNEANVAKYNQIKK